ncbi:MAG TPA: YggS family pyridoxal phosphate-dependent enzyme [Candidatus Deferrimicrobiaceae bacterium]
MGRGTGLSCAPSVRERVAEVRGRIAQAAARAGRRPEEVLLVGVSKRQPVDKLLEAHAAGVTVFGENYLQEAEGKVAALSDATWHFIGGLQGNKVKKAVSLFSCIQTVDSARLAAEISRRAAEAGRTMPLLIEVNVGGEESKGGVDPEGLPGLVEAIGKMPNLALRGLMAIPPMTGDAEGSRPYFARLRTLLASVRGVAPGMTELSMGMSDDYETAIEEGATMVRIGTALFGAREG